MLESMKSELVLASVMAGGIDPGVVPRMDAPWMPVLRDVAGWVLGTALVLFAIAAVLGIIVWVIGKATGSSRGQEVTLSIVLWVMLAAAITAGVSGLIGWATGLSLF